MSPLFMAGIIAAAMALLLRRDGDLRRRFLLSQFLPIYGLFLFFSLNSAGHANWTVPALVTGIIFTVVFWRELVARRPVWRWGVGASFILALGITIMLHFHFMGILYLPQQWDPKNKLDMSHRVLGWPDFAARVEKARVTNRANLLVASHYSLASLMAFYLPDQPTRYLAPAPYGSSQFTLWPDYQVTPDTRALFVTSGNGPVPKTLQNQFTRIELVDDFRSQHHGRPMNHVCIYLCTRE
jgi:hypothetical protein